MGDQREEISLRLQTLATDNGLILNICCDLGKQRLLMTEFQTPDVEHMSENWIRLVLLAYVQLWTTREERNTFRGASQRIQHPVVKSNQNQHLIIKLPA